MEGMEKHHRTTAIVSNNLALARSSNSGIQGTTFQRKRFEAQNRIFGGHSVTLRERVPPAQGHQPPSCNGE